MQTKILVFIPSDVFFSTYISDLKIGSAKTSFNLPLHQIN